MFIIVAAVAVLLLAVAVAYAVSKFRREAAKRKKERAAHAGNSQVVPLDSNQVAQTGGPVQLLVPTGAVKTSILVTRKDSDGNTTVHEREVAADHAAGQAELLPQGRPVWDSGPVQGY